MGTPPYAPTKVMHFHSVTALEPRVLSFLDAFERVLPLCSPLGNVRLHRD